MLQIEFWISELADRTGVSTRTIRYYIEEGLLPQPEIRGRYAIFTEDYLHRLELIKTLKDSYLPLREIKDLLAALNESEIMGLLQDMKQDPMTALSRLKALPVFSRPAPDTSIRESALDYIAHVRTNKPKPEPVLASTMPAPTLHMMQVPTTNKEEWVRFELKPGLELHVKQPISRHDQRLIDKLIDFIQNSTT